MNPIPAKRIADDGIPQAAGECRFSFDDQRRPIRIFFGCPCGCGECNAITLKPADPNGWEFDGNLDRPTISPGLQFPKNCRGCEWKGQLTGGMFETISEKDCQERLTENPESA